MALLRIIMDKLWDITHSTLRNMVQVVPQQRHYRVHNPPPLLIMGNSNNSPSKISKGSLNQLKHKLQTPSILPHPHNHINNTIQASTIRTNSEARPRFKVVLHSKPATQFLSLTQMQQLLLLNNKGNLITMDQTNSTNSRDRLNLLQLSNLHKSSSNNSSERSRHHTP